MAAKISFGKNEKVRMLVKGFSKWSRFDGGNYGKYSITILLDPENPEHAETIAKLEAWDKKARERVEEELAKIPPRKREDFKLKTRFGEDLNKDYEPTGYYQVTAVTAEPAVFDAKLHSVPLKPLSNGKLGIELGQGAEVAADITLKMYVNGDKIGYTAYLNGLQIIKKGTKSAMQVMFSKVDDGYNVEEEEEEVPDFTPDAPSSLEDLEKGDF